MNLEVDAGPFPMEEVSNWNKNILQQLSLLFRIILI
jgi:hypothetical protein